MTNAEYIKSRMTDADIAMMIVDRAGRKPNLCHKAYKAWRRWAESVSNNHGNIAGRIGHDDPSIWYWERWCYPGNVWKRKGRTMNVSVQVWLSKQYDPAEWGESDE